MSEFKNRCHILRKFLKHVVTNNLPEMSALTSVGPPYRSVTYNFEIKMIFKFLIELVFLFENGKKNIMRNGFLCLK